MLNLGERHGRFLDGKPCLIFLNIPLPRLLSICIKPNIVMLTPIENLPAHVFGVKAVGEVSEGDLRNTLLPGLSRLVAKYGEIYYLLVLRTRIENFTAGAWLQDMIAGIKHFTRWRKMAIVTDQKSVEQFTDIFSYVSPGEAKGFSLSEMDEAISWVSTRNS